MFKLTKKGDYGLIFLTHLAKSPPRAYIPLHLIAQTHQLPYKFISQIALKLKQAGLVKSKEGLGGGYCLNLPARQLSLARIIESLEGPLVPTSCLLGKPCPRHQTCGHQPLLAELSSVIRHTLATHTLAELAQKV